RHHHGADKARFSFSQSPLDHVRRDRRLGRVILREIADQDVGIEADQRCLVGNAPSIAPAAMASSISSKVTGDCRDGMVPRRAVTGTVGRRTTAPSGWMKYLTR